MNGRRAEEAFPQGLKPSVSSPVDVGAKAPTPFTLFMRWLLETFNRERVTWLSRENHTKR